VDTNHTILEMNGKPAFVILPYDEYARLINKQKPIGRVPPG